MWDVHFQFVFAQSVTAEVWCFGAEAIGMSPCNIARALLGLQQVNVAAPAPLAGPIHLQTERLGCGGSPSPSPAGLVRVAREEPAPQHIIQDPVSGNLQLSLCSWAKCSWPRVAHTPNPKCSRSSEGEGCLPWRRQGLSIFATSSTYSLLQDKAATNTGTCAHFPVQSKHLNPLRALQISPQGWTALLVARPGSPLQCPWLPFLQEVLSSAL